MKKHMNSSEVLGGRLSRQRRYVALILLLIFMPAGAASGVTIGNFGVKFIQGGYGNIIARWSSPANSFEAIAGLIGLSIGLLLGHRMWKFAMLRTGFLTPSQLDALNKPEEGGIKRS
jgi:hypothetical protein